MSTAFEEQRPHEKYDELIELTVCEIPAVSEAAARSFIDPDGAPYIVLWLVTDDQQQELVDHSAETVLSIYGEAWDPGRTGSRDQDISRENRGSPAPHVR